MTSNTDKLSYFHRKDALNDKEEDRLILNCSSCPNLEEHRNLKSECIYCLLKNLYINKNNIDKTTLVKIRGYQIKYNQFSSIIAFFKKISSIRKIWKKIDNIGKIKCNYQEFDCMIGILSNSPFSKDSNTIFEPILLLNYVFDKINELRRIEVINYDCQKCIKKVLIFLDNLLELFSKLDIIHKYKKFSNNNNKNDSIINFYNNVVFQIPFASLNNQLSKNPINTSKNNLIESYNIGENKIYQILIFNVINEFEKNYVVKFSIQSFGDEDFFKKIVIDAKNNLKLLDSDKII
ncbi:MAG: hypothetical protein ACTSQW_03690, partial [Promethearchaeota archaeon]